MLLLYPVDSVQMSCIIILYSFDMVASSMFGILVTPIPLIFFVGFLQNSIALY